MSGPASSPLRRRLPMLAGALSALLLVAVLAFAGGHFAFGGTGGDDGESACRNGNCRPSRCIRARDASGRRGGRGVTPPCPPVRARGAGEEEHARARPSWRFVPRPGP